MAHAIVSWKARVVPRLSASRHISILMKFAHVASDNYFLSFLTVLISNIIDNSQHSHEIGAANLAFTRRGRRAAAEAEKTKTGKHIRFANDDNSGSNTASSTPIPGPSSVPQQQPSPTNNYSSAVSMVAPLPTAQNTYQSASQPYNYQAQYQYAAAPAPVPAPAAPPPPGPPAQHTADAFSHERWQNMETLFQNVRDNARSFSYPTASVAALETVLLRLFLEGPTQPVMGQQPMAAPMMSQSMSGRMDDENSSDE